MKRKKKNVVTLKNKKKIFFLVKKKFPMSKQVDDIFYELYKEEGVFEV